MQINKVKVTPLFEKIENATEQTIVNAGGAGSSKSFSLIQFFLFKRLLIKQNYKLLVLRFTRQSNNLSVHQDFINATKEYNIFNREAYNKSDLIYNIGSNQARFSGLDDHEKIKSTEWHDIWLEEANEFSLHDYLFLKTRLFRGIKDPGFKPRIWMSFNPEDCWIFDLEGQPNVSFIYSNYKDNPFANQDYIQTLEDYKNIDETYYKIYTLGQRASFKGLIYKPLVMETEYPESFDYSIYGVDFGFNNPSVLLEINFKDNEIYIRELLYQSGLTNSELKAKFAQLIPKDKRQCDMYADSAEPARIEELARETEINGEKVKFNCKPADKAKDSVKFGIDFCKRYNIHTVIANENFNKDWKRYKWRLDKEGKSMDEPVKLNDHACDAGRYGIYTHHKYSKPEVLWF